MVLRDTKLVELGETWAHRVTIWPWHGLKNQTFHVQLSLTKLTKSCNCRAVELVETWPQQSHNMALAWLKKLDIPWTALFD